VATYVPTGRPAGRPTKEIAAQRAAEKEAAEKPISLPALDLTGITDPEKRMKAALTQLMGGLHEQLPKVLELVAKKDPKCVAQFYRDMTEYLAPKLSRSEQLVDGSVKVSHFVAVTDRESDPSRVIEGSLASD
jgi:hypothetical protein